MTRNSGADLLTRILSFYDFLGIIKIYDLFPERMIRTYFVKDPPRFPKISKEQTNRPTCNLAAVGGSLCELSESRPPECGVSWRCRFGSGLSRSMALPNSRSGESALRSPAATSEPQRGKRRARTMTRQLTHIRPSSSLIKKFDGLALDPR